VAPTKAAAVLRAKPKRFLPLMRMTRAEAAQEGASDMETLRCVVEVTMNAPRMVLRDSRAGR